MSLLSSWGARESKNLAEEASPARLASLSEKEVSVLWYDSLATGDIIAVRNIVSRDPALINQKMYGFEGHDVYGIVPNSKSGRCYTHTNNEKDGFFYPLHIAAEMGHKKLVILLVQAGADEAALDYRGDSAESKSNGDAVHAFYELKGYRFESQEVYEGQYDRYGKRYRQGSLYYKAEGYFESLSLLYRGGWKDDKYSGHGTLYWTGSTNLKYTGRFKDGVFNGMGSLYTQDGEKVYTGQFKDGQKEGRGEEFSKEGKLVYKGEFSAGSRHGFGVVYLSEGHRYMGRLDKGVMTGMGVYFHPDGKRFEGNFFNNKPDGHGSFYEVDPSTGREISATHAMWTMGRKTSEINFPFEAKKKDLPALAKADGDEEGGEGEGMDWKKHICKYIRLTRKKAAEFDIADELGLVKEDDEEEDDEEEDLGLDADDIHNFHFVEVPALFVAYSYVMSAAKVFEERKITRDLRNLPDFEVVYQVVLDAIENYNEQWVEAWQAQERSKVSNDENKGDDANSNNARAEAEDKKAASANKSKKRLLFMSESEKKAEILKKHTAEMNINKATQILDPTVERNLGKKILSELEGEITQELEVVVEDVITGSDASESRTERFVVTNDFASELLYIMRSAGDMLGE